MIVKSDFVVNSTKSKRSSIASRFNSRTPNFGRLIDDIVISWSFSVSWMDWIAAVPLPSLPPKVYLGSFTSNRSVARNRLPKLDAFLSGVIRILSTCSKDLSADYSPLVLLFIDPDGKRYEKTRKTVAIQEEAAGARRTAETGAAVGRANRPNLTSASPLTTSAPRQHQEQVSDTERRRQELNESPTNVGADPSPAAATLASKETSRVEADKTSSGAAVMFKRYLACWPLQAFSFGLWISLLLYFYFDATVITIVTFVAIHVVGFGTFWGVEFVVS